MATFGICTGIGRSADVKQAGWDFIEENAQSLFKGTEPDEKYDGAERVKSSVLPVYAANCLVPGALKITGPSVDMDALRQYMANVLRRAGEARCGRLVFGSGGARQVPAGWDKAKATDQIVEFGKMIAPLAQANGVMVVLEHLCLKECNIVNDLVEEVAIVERVGHPAFRALLDTYHLWTDELPISQVEQIAGYVQHVHVADKEGRVAPGESKSADYRPVFRILKKAGYSGGISVEASGFGDFAGTGSRVLAFLKQQWDEA